MGDLFGDMRIATGGVSFIADNMILLRYAEIESALRKVMMVIKMRTSDHDKELRQYRITERGVIVEAPFTQYSGVSPASRRCARSPAPSPSRRG